MLLPKDPYHTTKLINTKLRNDYNSLDDLCKGMNIISNDIADSLLPTEVIYDQCQNQFISKE